MLEKNIILDTDSYKLSHYKQYPPGTQTIYSYIESRGGESDATVFFGLQMVVKEYLTTPITQTHILEAKEISENHGLPFNEEGWQYILDKHKGHLPIRIRAVPEGTVVPVGNVLVTMENTDPNCFWLTNYLETLILRGVWYPTTVATNSYNIKQLLKEYWEKTSDAPIETLDFKLHDFGARGVSSRESAGIGGAAHLVNFKGTDTLTGVLYARKYYHEKMAGFSIPAAEHSTITSWGREKEVEAYANMIVQYAGKGKLLAVVSDSYDIHNAVRNIWGKELKAAVKGQGGTVVIRPDSGVPHKIVPQVISDLIGAFGGEYNSKGYIVLPDYIRVIQGDGINYDSIKKILEELEVRKMSVDNIAFGMGGALLQQLDRDTFQFAMKCCAIEKDGVWRDVWKEPVSDVDMSFKKRSKPGRMTLIWDNEENKHKTVRYPLAHHPFRAEPQDKWAFWEIMDTVFENGKLLVDENFEKIRQRAAE